MKLADIKPITGKFYLKHPVTLDNLKDDNEEDVYLDVVGRDSDEYVTATHEFLKHIEELGDEAEKITALDYKDLTATQLGSCITGWDKKFNGYMGGKYTPELIETLLHSQDHKWIVTQLDLFVSTRSHFFTN